MPIAPRSTLSGTACSADLRNRLISSALMLSAPDQKRVALSYVVSFGGLLYASNTAAIEPLRRSYAEATAPTGPGALLVSVTVAPTSEPARIRWTIDGLSAGTFPTCSVGVLRLDHPAPGALDGA